MSACIRWFIGFIIVLQFFVITTVNTSLHDTDLQWYRVSKRREKCELINLILRYYLILLSIVFGIGIVRFENGVCNSSSSLEGTCYTRYQCRSVSGFASGRCANNIGVCCVSKYLNVPQLICETKPTSCVLLRT